MREKLLKLSRKQKTLTMLAIDLLIVWLALFGAFYLRLGYEDFVPSYLNSFYISGLLASVISLPVFYCLGLYRALLRYMGQHVSFIILRASFLSFLMLTVAITLLGVPVPRSVPVLYWLLSALLLGVSRYGVRFWLRGFRFRDILFAPIKLPQARSHELSGQPVAVYGAGEAGNQLVEALEHSREFRPVAFIDDDIRLRGRTIAGCRVFAPDALDRLILQTGAQEVLLAVPSASRQRRREIVRHLETYGLPIKTMPGIQDLASGRARVQEIMEVDIGDVLSRDEVAPIAELVEQDIVDQVVMVTGAGGSIGSEMARQALVRKPKMLVLLEHSEFNLYTIDQELQGTIRTLGLNIPVISVLGSINDPVRLLDVMNSYQVETLYHAAAYKHVPLVQYNVSQGLRNNVMGTLYTAQAAILAGVKQFVLISTDKAVRPTNVMGASKRLAEMVLQALSNEQEIRLFQPELFGSTPGTVIPNNTRFTMVRFGNVLGSSGSVIPLFREQIRTGGPVTVTHPEINRYFMTIPEAAQLVIQAGAMGQGGDVFVLDMGEPVKIIDLAKRMISLSGLSLKDELHPDGDIEIRFSGLRPGEKLYEELLIGDNVEDTIHPRISRAFEELLAWEQLKVVLSEMIESLKEHRYSITRELLLRYVNGYAPSSKVVDWLYRHPGHWAVEDEVS
ncbi:polysaccharide biosynthesis protein [Endozoicomonas sp. ALB115]|uniref:polysaccharide biosynthesis protein n=1 Tax=Endozoicomonas sp. ALB115 TaxID=3403074 RepID=UPI003BB527AD